MSVVVESLSKHYGLQKAVDSVSFSVQKGEIVGFLGPNGAGKSTTMKMLTCFIPPTSGSASIAGFDIGAQSIQVRQRIGYLPEHNPLYKDMYIREYLSFVGKLHKVNALENRIEEMIHLTGLTKEANKKIMALSKGYRQRVGLAQALIHDPEVLILDEPTTGLDPNQLVEIRHLIKSLGKDKTVIFSSHILQEVQAICDRYLIINNGKIVADDRIDQLSTDSKIEHSILVRFAEPVDVKLLESLEGVLHAEHVKDNSYHISHKADVNISATVFQLALAQNNSIIELVQESRNVESVFQQLTNKKTDN
ncbi:MAG: gliding motility-associated ABC transporter ATP-binding subunit GldA [Saprospiraceae bacterium]